MQTSEGDAAENDPRRTGSYDDNCKVHDCFVSDEEANPFLSIGDQDLVGLWESTDTKKDHNVIRNWGIPSFSDQIDRGIRTFTLSRDDCPTPSVTLHLEHRLHSTGSDLWDSALVLAHCLARPGVVLPDDVNPSFYDRTVLELGSGTGAVGLFCAKCLHAKHAVLTDLKDNLDLLRKNRTENGLDEQVAICPLDWTHQTLPPEVYFDQTGADIVVGSDLCE
jgi:Lysine methyltransferase